MSVKFWWRYIHVLQKMRCEKSSAKGRPFCSCHSVFLEWSGYLFCLEEKFAIVNMLGITKFKRLCYHKFCVSIIANLPAELRVWVVFERQYYLCNIIYIYVYICGCYGTILVSRECSTLFIMHLRFSIRKHATTICLLHTIPYGLRIVVQIICQPLLPHLSPCSLHIIDGSLLTARTKDNACFSQWTNGPIIMSLLR